MTTNNEAMLTVGPSPDFPRRLWISVSSMSIGVALYPERTHRRALFAYALRPGTALGASQRIELDLGKSLLWIGGAQFELSPEEAAQVRDHFELLSLKITPSSPPPPHPTPGPEAAHVAVAAASPGSDDGMLPATDLVLGAGSLEAAWESY